MWKVLIYVTIAYLILTLITKIVDKRKVKKYGRDIVINGTIRDDSTDNDGNGNAESDKQ